MIRASCFARLRAWSSTVISPDATSTSKVRHPVTGARARSLCISRRIKFTLRPLHRLLAGRSQGCVRVALCDGGRNQSKSSGGPSMSVTRRTSIGILFFCALALVPKPAVADEGGISFWGPGFFGSLAATPQQAGWSLASIYYHTTVDAGPDVAFARQVHR